MLISSISQATLRCCLLIVKWRDSDIRRRSTLRYKQPRGVVGRPGHTVQLPARGIEDGDYSYRDKTA